MRDVIRLGSSHKNAPLVRVSTAVAVSLAILGARTDAQAQSRGIVGADLEVGGHLLVDPANSRLFGPGVGGAIDIEVNAHPVLGIHAGAIASYFVPGGGEQGITPSTGQPATQYLGGRLGLRFHWGELFRDMSHDFWIDAHGIVGVSGGLVRPGFDAGLGANFHVAHNVRIGPYIRFDWSHDPFGDHPMWLSAGIELALFGDPRHSSRDSDGDGVADTSDLCPTEAAGTHPDPRRPGCPSNDADTDGVFDVEDECPTVPSGAHPEPAHRGCPASDRDHDGVNDADDRCPTEAGPAPTGCPVHDADSDGIADERDACPTTGPGAHPDPERPGCPDGDDDADGVANHSDQCRTQPAGLHPDSARPGCPSPDRDNDSVTDARDACPDQPGAPSRDPRRNGCPGLTLITEGQLRILRPVFFARRRDRILPRSLPVLQAVADALLATPQITRISIEGHTDDVGDDARNLELSTRRAANVMAYLLTQGGVEPSRLSSRGFGETRPLVSAPTEDARAANRRVEFRIVEVEGQSSGSTTSPAPVSPAPSSPQP